MAQERVIREPEFAKRLETACDNNPNVPPLHKGRLVWVKDELFKRYKEKVSVETCRKWFAGEAKPRPPKLEKIAEMLSVDVSWLSLGIDQDLSPRERRARNAMADGVVNLIAGFIQMDGGHPAFPDESDKRAEKNHVDIYAIIKGANYAFHVSNGTRDANDFTFSLPNGLGDTIAIGVIRDGFSLQVFEIPTDIIESKGHRRGGSIGLTLSKGDLTPIKDFSQRL